jgi:hypothetical protein
MKLSDEYIAGFFDGEGHALLRDRAIRGAKASVDVEVAFSNTCRDVLALIHKRFGGQLYERQNGKRTIWRLRWTKRDEALMVLEALYPHLVIKRQRVGIIIGYLQSRLSSKGNYSDLDRRWLTKYKALGFARPRIEGN